MRFRTLFLIAGISLSFLLAAPVLFAPAHAQSDESDMACRATPAGKALDFWIGSWEVTDGANTRYGSNHIEWDASGCAIHEFWEGEDGNRGTSLFYFAINEDTWHQVWVTSDTSRTGGLKHKDMVEISENGAVQFLGQMTTNEDHDYLDRTTLTPNADGTVRQLIEYSMDDGATWRAGFDAVYSRTED